MRIINKYSPLTDTISGLTEEDKTKLDYLFFICIEHINSQHKIQKLYVKQLAIWIIKSTYKNISSDDVVNIVNNYIQKCDASSDLMKEVMKNTVSYTSEDDLYLDIARIIINDINEKNNNSSFMKSLLSLVTFVV